MDFKSMLNQLSQLSEATKETPTGRVHKADPGGYGRKYDTDEEGEEKKEKKAEGPKKRGRPPKTGEHSKEEQKKAKDRDEAGKRLQSAIVGNLPKGHDKKKGTVVKGKAQSGDKEDKKKKSIKEWVEEVEAKHSHDVNEGIMDTVKGMFGGSKPAPGRLTTYTPSEYEFHVPFMNVADGKPRAGTGPGYSEGAIWDKFNKLARIVEPQGGKMYIYPRPETNQLGNLIIKVKSNLDAKTIKNELAKNNLFPADFAKVILVDPQKNMDYARRAGQQFEQQDMAEDAPGQQLTVKPMPGASQLIDPATQKVVATGRADKISAMQKAMAQGEVQMPGKMEEANDDYSAKKARAGKDIGKPGKQFAKIAKSAGERYGSKERGEKVAGAVLAKLRKTNEGEIPHESGVDNIGAGLGAGRSQTTLESKKKVNESMHKHTAARLMGKAHALAKEGYNCKYEDMDEAKEYHEGYKEGLDECYGIRNEPIIGMEENIPATVPGMASQAMPAMEDDLDEMTKGQWMKHKAKETPGPTFKAFGQTMKDSDVLDEFAFESWDKELNSLLTESEEVTEGMTVSISKGQQGSPDSVSVSAQDGEADALLGLIKQAGLGLFGDEGNHIGAKADDTMLQKQGGINVVGDHDGMMALIKKVTGGDEGHDDADYADEEDAEEHSHDEEEVCNECGYMESKCECDEEKLEEVESEDQMAYEVAEDNAPDSGAAETTADENAEAAEDAALAAAMQQNKTNTVNEWANQVGKGPGKGTDASFEQDIEFMTKFIAGGLNKPKSTGQTTIPVIAGQETRMEDPMAWARLAGIKK